MTEDLSNAEREAREVSKKIGCSEDCEVDPRFVIQKALKKAEERGGGILLKNANEMIELLQGQVEHHKEMRRGDFSKGLLKGAEIAEKFDKESGCMDCMDTKHIAQAIRKESEE